MTSASAQAGTAPGSWIIHDEREVGRAGRGTLSVASVELPDGVRFDQYVVRSPPAAIVVVLDDQDRVLVMWRHRFILDKWVWELPGGYIDAGESPAEAAQREVLEETGFQVDEVEHLVSFQPMSGQADSENHVFLARAPRATGGATDVNETERVEWLPLDDALAAIAEGTVVGAGSVVGLLKVAAMRAAGDRLG